MGKLRTLQRRRHRHRLDRVARLLNEGWSRRDIAQAIGVTPASVGQLARRLIAEGRVDDPHRVAALEALADFKRLAVSVLVARFGD